MSTFKSLIIIAPIYPGFFYIFCNVLDFTGETVSALPIGVSLSFYNIAPTRYPVFVYCTVCGTVKFTNKFRVSK